MRIIVQSIIDLLTAQVDSRDQCVTETRPTEWISVVDESVVKQCVEQCSFQPSKFVFVNLNFSVRSGTICKALI